MKLTVAAQGGLCNRLRVLLGALALSERDKVMTRLVWHPDWQCEAYFDELFEPIESPYLKIVTGTFFDLPSSHKELYLPQVLRWPFYKKQIKLFHPQRHGELSDVVRKCGSLYINSGYEIAPYGKEQIDRLRPLGELQETVGKIVANFGKDVIGVHIRRADNKWSTDVSTDEAFIKAMQCYPDARFYIASDSDEVKWKMREQFKGRTLAQETDARRDNAFSIGEAVVDLFCLARTTRVIGSYWSSFSDLAAEIGNIPLEIAGKDAESDKE